MTCGIGSLLVGARDAGFDVVGNVEWRRYYHTGTFEANFPGATMRESLDDMTPDEIERFMGADYLCGHPECGAYSIFRTAAGNYGESHSDPSDIPLFVDATARLRPRFFVMDDLPKSFVAFPMEEYHRRLPEYDLYPEWVSNFHYGNVQKHRRRMFVIGARREERFAFVPGEEQNDRTMEDEIGDLADTSRPTNQANHRPHVLDRPSGIASSLETAGRGSRPTWRQISEYFAERPEGHVLAYVASDGSVKKRFGLSKPYWRGHCHVLTGGTNPTVHPVRGDPLTIRERARIQGFPDEFAFVGEIAEDDGTWDHARNSILVKQTGKAMPVQFGRYVARQIAAKIRGKTFEASGARLIKPNADVDAAKKWYCSEVGYSDQEAACDACWLKDACEVRREKIFVRG